MLFIAVSSHVAVVLGLSRPMFEAEWKLISSANRISPRRSGHVAFSSFSTQSVFVFGGYVEKDPEREEGKLVRYVDNDLWEFKSRAEGWKKVNHSGDIPAPRLVSAAAVVNRKAYLFGGWDPQIEGTGGIILDTVHELDLDTLEWKQLTDFPDGPTSRHVAVALSGERILIHNHRCLDFVWVFDTKRKTFVRQSTSGHGPGNVGLHVATMIDDETLFLFGGASKDGKMKNDSFLLNTRSWVWTPIKLADPENCPSPRAGASLCSYIGNKKQWKCAILFGGAESTETGLNPRGDVWMMRVDDDGLSGTWELLLSDATENGGIVRPPARNAATLTEIVSENGNESEYILTGGWAPFRQTWDDLYVLCLRNVS